MSKHTPGPWTMHPRFADGAEVRSLAQVAWCGSACEISKSGGQIIDAAEARANARLIAAAPDLLAACEMALLDMRYYATVHGESITAIEAAIAKAKGQSSSTDTARATE